MKTDWDYSDRAHSYDNRADYSVEALRQLFDKLACSPTIPVADIGAGTGKLTKELVKEGLSVFAVEPNKNMRMYGIDNTKSGNVIWSEGVGENTQLPENKFQACFFGSSFNVVNQEKALDEVNRILKPQGWFVCMWNHRDTDDPTQKMIENIITNHIDGYNYGTRRQDPSHLIKKPGYFRKVEKIEVKFNVKMSKTQIVDAWKSHDTLFRQADGNFSNIISAIAKSLDKSSYTVPYFTRIWVAQKN